MIKVSPGEILKYEFMQPLNLTSASLAEKLGVTCETVDQVISEEIKVDEALATKFSNVLGTTTEFWLNLQRNYDEKDSAK